MYRYNHLRDEEFTHINYYFKTESIELVNKLEILQTKL